MKSVYFAFAAAAAFVIAPTAAHAQKPAAQTKPAPAKTANKAAAKTAPLFCVITGEDIASVKDAAGKAAYKGKTYYFCCPGCVARFSKASDADKAKWTQANDVRVKQAMNAKPGATKPAKPAEAGMHHTANAAAKPATAGETKSGLVCPVTGEAIASVAEAAGSSVVNGKTVYFCCDGCKAKFDADPSRYAVK